MRFLLLALALTLTACTSAPEPRIQLAPIAPAAETTDSVVQSIELREISLPLGPCAFCPPRLTRVQS